MTVPVIAIGGISLDNLIEVMNCGAAVMSSIMMSENPERAVYMLKNLITRF
jgi:Thiamine monophosphate synthase